MEIKGIIEDLIFFFFYRLTCSVALRGGREGCCKQITLACARSASATLGLPPVHGACSLSVHAAQALGCSAANHPRPALGHGACGLPAHTAQALGCSAGNHPRLALGCMHLPGLSCSDSGTQVVLRGADSVGPAFCALPRSKQLR